MMRPAMMAPETKSAPVLFTSQMGILSGAMSGIFAVTAGGAMARPAVSEGMPGEVEDALSSVNLPWLLQVILDFFSANPAAALLLISLLVLGLAASLALGWLRSRAVERVLEEKEESFPRRRWEQMGRLDAARIIEDMIPYLQNRPTEESVACHYGVLGILYLQRGNAQIAERLLSRAVVLFESMGHREGIALYARHLGMLYAEMGDTERAAALANRSLVMHAGLRETPEVQERRADLRAMIAAAQAGETPPNAGGDPDDPEDRNMP